MINEQISGDYDIFVGILWARFGTPTKRAGSGTEEEFNLAYARYQADPAALSIMVYFKQEAVSPHRLDADQLKAVQDFRRRIEKRGLLTWEFKDSADFASQFRKHLSKEAQAWRKRHDGDQTQAAPPSAEPTGASGTEAGPAEANAHVDRGLESALYQQSLTSFRDASCVRGRISVALTGLMAGIQGTDQAVRDAQRAGVVVYMGETLVQAFDQLAGSFDELAGSIDAAIPTLVRNYREGASAFAEALDHRATPGPVAREDTQVARSSLQMAADALIRDRQATNYLRDMIGGMPRGTQRYQKARERLLDLLAKLDATFGEASGLVQDLVQRLESTTE